MGNKKLAAAALALLTVGIPAPASADVQQRLSITSAGDIVAAAAKGRIAVLDVSGDMITEVAAASGAGVIADVAISSDGRKVAVSRATPAMAINNNGKVYNYHQRATLTANLGTTYKNRTVEIWADPYGSDQARRLVKRGTVNSAGKVTASFKLTRNTKFSAVFTGDARYAPRTVTATVGTKANLAL